MQTNIHIHINTEPYKFKELVVCSKQKMKKTFFYAYTDECLKFYLNCRDRCSFNKILALFICKNLLSIERQEE